MIPDYAKGKVQPPCFIYETKAIPNYASPLRKYCKELGYPVIDFFNKGTYFVQFNTNTELKSFVQKVKNHEFGYFDSWRSVGRDEDEEKDDDWLRQVYYHDYLDEQETQNDPEKKKKFDDLMAKLKKMNGVK